jgi:hypothetical protein
MKELINIQSELKAPKGQNNDFGKYKYRSCEDILESVKPLLTINKCFLTINDEIVLIGERYYVKATAVLKGEKESIEVSAFAREPANKKGMDESQITGASSSYARKYALNGLFAIDDTKDSDSTNTGESNGQMKAKASQTKMKVEAVKESLQIKESVDRINDILHSGQIDSEMKVKTIGWLKKDHSLEAYGKMLTKLHSVVVSDETPF